MTAYMQGIISSSEKGLNREAGGTQNPEIHIIFFGEVSKVPV
jgi:hypothetical protein